MMNKKGASHADWAISLGIFLVYILSLFLIIQPGVEPIYREDTLLEIVKDAFEGEMNYTIEKTQLVITPGPEMPLGEQEVMVFSDTEFPFDQQLALDGHYTILESSEHNFKQVPNKIFFESNFVAGPNKFTILYSPEGTYGFQDETLSNCITNKAEPEGCAPEDGNDFTYVLGAKEIIKGLSDSKFETLGEECLATGDKEADRERFRQIKERWNFPLNKEFSIYYVEGSKPQYEVGDIEWICDIAKPTNQSSVFVKEFGSWDITPEGGMDPIRVNIKVW